MTNTQRFIELAKKGGYETGAYQFNGAVYASQEDLLSSRGTRQVTDFLLDPLAWAAVGKVLGWPGDIKAQAKYYMREFITYIAAGKSIEAALGEVLALNSK